MAEPELEISITALPSTDRSCETDGLGLLGYEAALTRDYPVIFATLYFFSLLGLVMGIIGDFMYSIIDPKIDFESR